MKNLRTPATNKVQNDHKANGKYNNENTEELTDLINGPNIGGRSAGSVKLIMQRAT